MVKREISHLAQEFRLTWDQGLVICEPDVLRIEMSEDKDSVLFVLEDCFSNPNFWDFNSMVVPEKKMVVGPFYLSRFESRLFYLRSPRLTARVVKFK